MMDVAEGIATRRSVGWLVEPAPGDAELMNLLGQAMTAPDHGMLRPWRLVVVRGDARQLLGSAVASTCGASAERERAVAKTLRAPLLLSIVFAPRPSPKVAEWEQLCATSALVHNLSLLLHAHGWASIWRTGRAVDVAAVRDVLGLRSAERLLGWLYVGTPDPAHRLVPRPAVNPLPHVSELSLSGRTHPISLLAARS